MGRKLKFPQNDIALQKIIYCTILEHIKYFNDSIRYGDRGIKIGEAGYLGRANET